MSLTYNKKHHRFLNMLRACPFEDGEGFASANAIAMLRRHDMIVAHPDTPKDSLLLETAFDLTEKGQEILLSWDEQYGRITEFDTPDARHSL